MCSQGSTIPISAGFRSMGKIQNAILFCDMRLRLSCVYSDGSASMDWHNQ